MPTTAPSIKPDSVFRALSDKTRLRILHLLLKGELCVCDIVAALQVPQPTASRHLAYLRKVGMVLTRRDGIWNYYQLTPPANQFDRAVRESIKACSGIPRMTKDLACLTKTQSKCCE